MPADSDNAGRGTPTGPICETYLITGEQTQYCSRMMGFITAEQQFASTKGGWDKEGT